MNWKKIFGFTEPRSFGSYVKKPSPDKGLLIVFSRGDEIAMMRYSHQFRLIDPAGAVLEAFKGLDSTVQRAWWTPDSRIVAIPSDGLLLFDVRTRRYSVIRFDSYQSLVQLTSRGARIGVDTAEFRRAFGRRFSPPKATRFPFSSLRWQPAPEAWDLGPALRRAPRPGWHPPPSAELKAYARKHHIALSL